MTPSLSLQAQLDRMTMPGALVEVVATLARSRITTADLLGLRVGDIVTTEKGVRDPLELAVEGAAKFRASPGAVKGQKAIQIVGPIDGG